MKKKTILFARIDDRFLHGQVGIAWNQQIGAKCFLIANDSLAEDSLQQSIMRAAAPSGTSVTFLSMDAAASALLSDKLQKVFLLVGSADDVLKLMDAGVEIGQVNVGNLQNIDGREQVTPSVYVNNEDRRAFGELFRRSVKVEIQRVPTSPIEDPSRLVHT